MSCETCDILDLIFEDGITICSTCGKMADHPIQYVEGIDTFLQDPLQICVYQRRKRFEQILVKITLPYMDTKDVPVYKLLEKQTFKNRERIMDALRRLPLKDKRYHSVHLFCKLLLRNYEPPDIFSLHDKKHCMIFFYQIESMFLRHKRVPFFNYAWLLRRILNYLGYTAYDKYIKRIKCPKRNSYYEEMFSDLHTKILTRDGAESCP
jgi:hypothetical protein